MSGPFRLSTGGGGSGEKRKRIVLGPVPKCGECNTCLKPSLKKACLKNRPVVAAARGITLPSGGGGGGASGGGGTWGGARVPLGPSILETMPGPEEEKPPPPHGILGFRLPVVPETRPRKWARRWCVTRRARRDARPLSGARRRRLLQETLESGGAPCWLLRWLPGALFGGEPLLACAQRRAHRVARRRAA